MRMILLMTAILISNKSLAAGILTSDVSKACDLNLRHANSYCTKQSTNQGVTKFEKCDGVEKVEISTTEHNKLVSPKYGEHRVCKVVKSFKDHTETTVYNSFGTKFVTEDRQAYSTTRIYSDEGYLTVHRESKKQEPIFSFFDYEKNKENYLNTMFERKLVFEFIKKNTATLSTDWLVAQTK